MRKTRYVELGYDNYGPGYWRIIDITDGRESVVGPHYVTKAELLADLDRYATDFGCEAATRPPDNLCWSPLDRALGIDQWSDSPGQYSTSVDRLSTLNPIGRYHDE